LLVAFYFGCLTRIKKSYIPIPSRYIPAVIAIQTRVITAVTNTPLVTCDNATHHRAGIKAMRVSITPCASI
jgi:hypothetical protein